MARDRASIRIDLWADEDWRKLSLGAQHLYMLILSHSTLNYAGVADWRAGRLSALTYAGHPRLYEKTQKSFPPLTLSLPTR